MTIFLQASATTDFDILETHVFNNFFLKNAAKIQQKYLNMNNKLLKNLSLLYFT